MTFYYESKFSFNVVNQSYNFLKLNSLFVTSLLLKTQWNFMVFYDFFQNKWKTGKNLLQTSVWSLFRLHSPIHIQNLFVSFFTWSHGYCFESRFMLITLNQSPFSSPNLGWKHCSLHPTLALRTREA